MRVILLILITTIFISPKISAEEQATLKVSGLVCSFCIQGITKSFQKTKTITAVDVDLDNHEVKLKFIPGKNLSDLEIREILESTGYNLITIDRFSMEKK